MALSWRQSLAVTLEHRDGLSCHLQCRWGAVRAVKQCRNIDFRVQGDEPLHLTHCLATVIDAADLDLLLRHPELDADEPAARQRHGLHCRVGFLQNVDRGRWHFDETESDSGRHGEEETGREVAMSALVLGTFLRIADAVLDVLVLSQDDGAAAPHALCTVGPLITNRRRVHLAVAPAVMAILREVLPAAFRPCN